MGQTLSRFSSHLIVLPLYMSFIKGFVAMLPPVHAFLDVLSLQSTSNATSHTSFSEFVRTLNPLVLSMETDATHVASKWSRSAPRYFVNALTIFAAMCRKKILAMNDKESTMTTNGSLPVPCQLISIVNPFCRTNEFERMSSVRRSGVNQGGTSVHFQTCLSRIRV